MNLQDEINSTLSETETKLAGDPAFRELQEFYREKISEGIALKQAYSLPFLDTIGRGIYSYFGSNSSGPTRREKPR